MTRIYLIRHAEAEGNLYRIAHGQYNSSLTEKGWKQVEALRDRFRDKKIDAVYSSDLYRARATAAAICRCWNLPLHTMEELREVDVGEWECIPWAQLRRKDARRLHDFNVAPHQYEPLGGETFLQVQERMLAAIRRIAAEHPGQSVAVVSHGAAIRTLLNAAEGKPLSQLGQAPFGENTAVSLLEVDGEQMHLVFRDSDSHLAAGGLYTKAGQAFKKPGGDKDRGLCFSPMDLQEDGERYLFCRAEYLKSVYGHLEGFDGPALLQQAMSLPARYPAAVMEATLDGEMAGMFQLYPDFGAEDHAGYIDFYYLLPPFRNLGFGEQMLGQIIMFYRQLNRDRLRLMVEAENEGARRFFARCGFGEAGTLPDGRIIMQKFFGYRPL